MSFNTKCLKFSILKKEEIILTFHSYERLKTVLFLTSIVTYERKENVSLFILTSRPRTASCQIGGNLIDSAKSLFEISLQQVLGQIVLLFCQSSVPVASEIDGKSEKQGLEAFFKKIID